MIHFKEFPSQCHCVTYSKKFRSHNFWNKWSSRYHQTYGRISGCKSDTVHCLNKQQRSWGCHKHLWNFVDTLAGSNVNSHAMKLIVRLGSWRFPSRFRSPGCLCWHPDFRNHRDMAAICSSRWFITHSHVLLSRHELSLSKGLLQNRMLPQKLGSSVWTPEHSRTSKKVGSVLLWLNSLWYKNIYHLLFQYIFKILRDRNTVHLSIHI